MIDLHAIMTNNCWNWRGRHIIPSTGEEDALLIEYRATFTGMYYESEVAALVSENDDSLLEFNFFGVTRLEAYYKPDPPYEWYELQDAQKAIELAEDNLLRIGMPFDPDFSFRGRNKMNKIRRNLALRKKYGLPEYETKRLEKLDGR